MSSPIVKTATSSMESSESDSSRAFKLFLELITPVEFSRLLIARVQHLLRVWPPQTAATTATKTTSQAKFQSNSLSLESICAFLTFFRTPDSPKLPSSDLTTSTSVQTLYDHLVALETFLSVSSSREIQSVLCTRLDDIVEDRDTIIQGLLDVLRSNTEDDVEDENSKQGNAAKTVDIATSRDVPSSSTSVTARTGRVIAETRDKECNEGSPKKRRRTKVAQETEFDLEPNDKESNKSLSTIVMRSSAASSLADVSPRRSRRISRIDVDTSSLPRTRLRSRSSVDGQGFSEKPTASGARPKRKAQDGETSSEDEEFKRLTLLKLQPSPSSRPRRSNIEKSMVFPSPSSGDEQDAEKVDNMVIGIPQSSHGGKEMPARTARSRRLARPNLTDSSTMESMRMRSKTIAVPRPVVARGRRRRLSQRNRNVVISDKSTDLSETEATGEEVKTNEKSALSHSDAQMDLPAASNDDGVEPSGSISKVQIRSTHPCNSIDKGAQSIVIEPSPSTPSLTSSDERASPPGPVLRAVNWTNGRLSPSANVELDDNDGPDDDSMDVSNVNGNETRRMRSIPSTPADVISADISPALYGQAVREQRGLPENTNTVELRPIPDPPSRLMRHPKDVQMPSTSDDRNEDNSQTRKEVPPVTNVETLSLRIPSGKPYQPPQALIFAPSNTPQYSPLRPHSDSGISSTSTASIPPYVLPPPVQTQPRHAATALNTSPPSAPPSSLSPSFPLNAPQQQHTHPDTFPYRTVPLHPVPTGPMLPQSMSHPPQATSHFGPPPPAHPYSISAQHPSASPQYHPHYPVPQAPQGSPPNYSSGPWVGTMLYVPYRGTSTAPPPPSPTSHFGPPPYGSPQQHPHHPSHPQHSPYPPPQHSSHPFLYHNPYPPHQPQPYQRPHPPPHYHHHQSASQHYEQPVFTNQQQQSPSHMHSTPTPISPPHQESIPPPSGPYPRHSSTLIPAPAPHRTSSPPVRPPEGPKRNVSRLPDDEEEDSDVSPNSHAAEPELTYTDEAGMKETPLVRRRCHNCDAIDAPSWRKSKLIPGKILCNKCGIYESTHQAARPLRTRPRRAYYVDTQKKKKKYKRDVLGFSDEVNELIKEGASFDFVLR